MMTSLPRNPVSRSEAGTLASGAEPWRTFSKRRWSRSAVWVSRTCVTASMAVLAEATGDPGMSCSDRPAHTAQTAVRAASPRHGGDVNRCCGDCADEQDETEAERGERNVSERG